MFLLYWNSLVQIVSNGKMCICARDWPDQRNRRLYIVHRQLHARLFQVVIFILCVMVVSYVVVYGSRSIAGALLRKTGIETTNRSAHAILQVLP